jgi:hypothetical protein
MSDESKGLLIKYGTFTLFLIIGIIMFFTGLLNGGAGKDGNLVFTMIFVSGFMLSGASILFIFLSLTEDF